MVTNPFKPATPVAKKLKLLFYGPSGSGKTVAALSFPKVAIIDAEGGSDLYAGRPGIKPFSILRCKTLTELENAIKFIREDEGKSFETLVIDPITVFYDVLKDAMARIREQANKDMTYREWAKINQKMRSLYEKLTDLPVHVIIIAREAVEYEGSGDSLKKVGNKPDADKSLIYMFDYAIKFDINHSGYVLKSRGFDIGSKLEKVNWSAFEKASLAFVDGETAKHQAGDEAVDREMSGFAEDEGTAQRPPANGNGHSKDDLPPVEWHRDTEKLASYAKYLMQFTNLTPEQAEKKLGKPASAFESAREAINAVQAAIAKEEPPAQPKTKQNDNPWYQKEMQGLSMFLGENFGETPSRVLPKLGVAAWSEFASRQEAESMIREVAAKELWTVTAKQASYLKTSDGKMFIQLHTALAKLPWYKGRRALVAAVADTSAEDWSGVPAWGEGLHDLPEPIRVAIKRDGEYLAIESIHSAVGIPF